MKQFFKLIQNELHKGFFQKKTIVFIVFLIFCVCVCAVINISDDNVDWRKETQEQIVSLEQNIIEAENNIKNPELDETVREMEQSMLEFQKEELKVQKYRLENEIPESVVTPLKFVYKCKSLFFLVSLFIAVYSANTIVNEYNWGTIRQLFIKPISRNKIFWAKYVSTVLIAIILFGVLFAVSILLGYTFFGDNTTSIYEIVLSDGVIELENMLTSIIKHTIVNLFQVCIIGGISICVASVVHNNVLAILISLGVWLSDAFIGEFFRENIIYKNFIVANISLENFLAGGILPYEGATMLRAVIICLIYLIIFLMIGKHFFSKRDVY